MPSVNITDKEGMRRLNLAVEDYMRDCGRSVYDAVTKGGMLVAESARARSRPSKTKRDIIDNPEWKQARGSFAWARRQKKLGKPIPAEAEAALASIAEWASPYFILRYNQKSSEPFRMLAWSKSDPRRVIEKRGLAKTIWNKMAASLATSGKGDTSAPTTGRLMRDEFGQVAAYFEKYGKTSGSYVVRLQNALNYAETAYPGIMAVAVDNATARMRRLAEMAVERRTKRMNAA